MPIQLTIGLLGGTFDPIHCGHLRMALELYERLQLNKVHLIPCHQPVHRAAPIASVTARIEMIQHAIQHETALHLDLREIERHAPSYFIDTLISLRQEMPHAAFCLFLGIDAFLGFASWHRYTEILNDTHIIVTHRPPFTLPHEGTVAELLATHLQQDTAYIHHHRAGGILLQPIPTLEISSSQIRKQIAMGLNPRYLLPDGVYNYIKQNHIYSQ